MVEEVLLNLKGDEWDDQMGEHCWKSILCWPLGYNHHPNGVVFDKFRYGCSCKAKMGKCIYFTSFPTET